ncbi:nitrogen fixation protein NifQ [uncultured Thiodictyon sp.]|uniref:nitrogen fixation protein NifQ n=1 Tax=uncultured Thiodictyon sp. TaxID=1846217 RepID=UPI0025D24728|nr:nitrogen fixation protein NifQ [uncultured Thiodictyon sp.]
MTTPPRIHDQASLLATARDPADELTLAFACVIGQALAVGQRPLIRGLPAADFQRLLDAYFPGAGLVNDETAADPALADELADLLELLLEFRREPSEALTWLSHAVASAALRDNHLWQDMGLPNRALLSALMTHQFPGLATLNSGDMKWKKFFYRKLCERADVPICKSPHCEQCVDYRACFSHTDDHI